MKLFNIFKKNKQRFVTQELISLNALAKVPDIDYFKDNNQFLLLINLRKKEYLETLIKEKVLTSSELKSGKLQDKLNMLHNLIEQNTLGNDLFEKVIFDEEDKVKALIILRKFTIYNEKIIELEEEVVSRIIALKEILKRTFLNKQKRISIINEVNRLTNVFIILMNQKETLKVCLSSYSKKCFDITKERDLEKEETLIKKRKKELNEYQEQAFGKINTQINNLSDMALVEVALEEYIYVNKEKINEEIANLNEVSLLNNGLDNLKKVITKFNLYYELGKNVIPIDYIKRLYEIKFRLLTMNIVGCIEPFITEQTRELELTVYKEIIEKYLHEIITQKENGIYGKDWKKVLSLIKEELKINGKYDPLEILKDKYYLNFLLAAKGNALDIFYDNYLVEKKNFPEIHFFDDLFVWDDELPIATIYRLKNFQNPKKKNILYELTIKHSSKNNNGFYYIPEGIKEIDTLGKSFWALAPYSLDTKDFARYLEYMKKQNINNYLYLYLKKLVEWKKVVFPKSLRKVKGNFFDICYVYETHFNEGLEELDCSVLNGLDKVVIPGGIKKIIPNKKIKKLKYLEFDISKDASILYDKEQFKNLLEGQIYIDIINDDPNSIHMAIKSNLQTISFNYYDVFVYSIDVDAFDNKISNMKIDYKIKYLHDDNNNKVIEEAESKDLYIEMLLEKIYELPFIKDSEKYGIYKKELKKNN